MNVKKTLNLFLLPLTLGLLVACGPSAAQGESAAPQVVQTETQTETPAQTPAQTQTETRGRENSVRAVRTVQAEQGTLTTSRSSSVTVEPAQESQVAARTSGQVATILQREGSVVAHGDVVVRLDAENLRLQADNARVAVQSARVNLKKAQNASQEGGQQAQSGLRTAQANLDLVTRQVTESRQLFEAGAVSATDLANLETQLTQAQASAEQAQNAVNQSGRAGGEDLELLRLQLEQAQTQLTQAERALADADIKAPFAGEIAALNTEIGEFVGAGSPAFTLVSTDKQLARFSVPPQDAQRLLSDGLVYVSYGGLDYAAQITRSSEVPGQSRLVEITAEIYPSETRIPTGAVAEVDYDVELAEGIRLPAGAIKTSVGQSYVFVADGGTATRQDVTILGESGGRSVVSGVENGAEIIYPVPSDLRDGLNVNVLAVTER